MTLVYEKNVPVAFVPTIADITAPTAVEVDAGEQFASYIPKDGVQFPANRNMVPTDALDSDVDSESPGSIGGTLVVTFKRQNRDGDEAAWTAFKDSEPASPVTGFLVFGFQGSNAAAADEVDVYQVEAHMPVRANPAANTEQRFVVNFGVQAMALGAAVSGP